MARKGAIVKTITQDEKLQLMGIMALANSHYKIIDQCYDQVTKILGEESTHIHDSLYEQVSMVQFDALLEKAGIEVES